MAETVNLVEIDLGSIINDLDAVTDKIVDLEEAQKSLRKDAKKTNDELEAEGKNRSELSKEIAINAEELKDLKKERAANIKLIKSEANSVNQLEARNKKLLKQIKDIDASTEAGRKELKALNVEYAENKAAIDEIVDKQHVLTDALNEHTEAVKANGEQLNQMGDALEGAGGGAGQLIGSLKAFLANPYVAVFAAIAGVITAIGGALKSTRGGSMALAKSMTTVSATTEVMGNKMSKGVANLASGEVKLRDVQKLMRDLGKDFLSGGDALQKFTKAQTDQIKEVSKLKKELIDLNSAYIDIENELLSQMATARGLGDIQMSIADDATRSIQERRAAAQKAADFDKKANEAAVKLAEERLAISEKEIEIGITNGALVRDSEGNLKSLSAAGIELEKAYSEASIAAIEANSMLTQSTIENKKRIREINQDDFEQELDFLLDIADASKTVNEQQIADQRLALDERKKILAETQNLVEDSYDDQVDLFERDLGVQLERDKIMKLNNKEIFEYARGLGLSEIATNRLREVIIERRKAVQDLGMAERDLNEEAAARNAKALATIDAYQKAELLKITEGREAKRALEVQWAEEDLAEALTNKDLLDSEIEALEVEHLQALAKINKKYRETETKEDEKTIYTRKQILEDALAVAGAATSQFFTFRKTSNQQTLDAELAAAGDNQEKVKAANKKAARENQKIAINEALINGALALTKIFATVPPPASFALAAVQAITTAGLVTNIARQKFAQGGEVKAFSVSGASHAQGGVDLSIGGRSVAEIEGDEGVYIVNKKDNPAAIASLSATNSIHGKAFAPSRYMQDGGEAVTGGLSIEDAITLLRAAPIQVQVTDINTAQSNEVAVVANGEI